MKLLCDIKLFRLTVSFVRLSNLTRAYLQEITTQPMLRMMML
ncbi:hypothetical protein HanPI659440_Chr16g0660291 [Helianthus annuus]|nr:hypothetical protein HanPI659440_Chr16g0660291 [Helianthus annuus]